MISHLKTKNEFYGKECLVIACGPSARYWKNIYDINNDQFLITIKQSIDMVPQGKSQIHFFNAHNCKNYYLDNRVRPTKYRIFQDDLDGPRQFNEFDLRFCVCKNKTKPWEDCLALNKQIDKYNLENSGIKRPWGPGIVFESVLYTLEYMGFKKITLVGFDNGKSKNYGHFYDNQEKRKKAYRKETKSFDQTTISYYRHIAGLEYNSGMKPMEIQGFNESQRINELLPLFDEWMETRGVEFKIYTDFSGEISNYRFTKDVKSMIA